MGKEKSVMTNALRQLSAKKIAYRTHTYEAPSGFLDGVSVAQATGLAPERVFKTLVTQGASKEYYVCVIPVAKELDLKKAAKHFKEKSIAMIRARDITTVTGYIKGGCSPVGMKKKYPTAIDSSAAAYDFIAVSGGKVGLQMELAVADLCVLTGAQLVELTEQPASAGVQTLEEQR